MSQPIIRHPGYIKWVKQKRRYGKARSNQQPWIHGGIAGKSEEKVSVDRVQKTDECFASVKTWQLLKGGRRHRIDQAAWN